jgi:hypothetical protein
MMESSHSRDFSEIIYHFDVERNSIPLAQFIETARATQEIIDDFNRWLFDGKLKYELRVKTPEEGSLIEVFTVMITVGAPIWAFFGTDIGKAFVKGLTGELPAVWAEKTGAAIRQKLFKSKVAVHKEDSETSVETIVSPPVPIEDVKILSEIEGEAVALLLVSFLIIDTETLKKIGITPEKFRSAFHGRNRIFMGCIENSEVKGIAFDRSSEFFIKRRDLPSRIVQISEPITPSSDNYSVLNFETIDTIVNSPNWKRDGRNWQAAANKYQDISFSIDDESFWQRVEQRDPDLKPTIRDNMRVQWAYPAGAAKPSHVKVLRVLSYNGRKLSNPMSDQEIQALQSKVHFVESETPDLFDDRHGLNDKNEKGGK